MSNLLWGSLCRLGTEDGGDSRGICGWKRVAREMAMSVGFLVEF